jgi:hypothetical protein
MKNTDKPFGPPENISGAIVAQSVEQARVAMNNYLQFLEKSMSALPRAETDQTKKWMRNAEQNVAAAFEFVEKLTHVKDIQDVARIQTEFVKKQMQTLGDQAKDFDVAATQKIMEDALGHPDC